MKEIPFLLRPAHLLFSPLRNKRKILLMCLLDIQNRTEQRKFLYIYSFLCKAKNEWFIYFI